MKSFGKRRDGPGGRREAARAPILLRAALHTVSSSRAVTLFDVSATGAHVSMPEPLCQGQTMWLKIQPNIIFGTVVWVGEADCGISFDVPLDEQELATLQAKGKVVMIPGLSADEQLGAEDWQSNFAR